MGHTLYYLKDIARDINSPWVQCLLKHILADVNHTFYVSCKLMQSISILNTHKIQTIHMLQQLAISCSGSSNKGRTICKLPEGGHQKSLKNLLAQKKDEKNLSAIKN